MQERTDSLRLSSLDAFQNKINIHFKNISLLDSAMTHRSCINEVSSKSGSAIEHNERLEFLGDAVVGQAVAAYLYKLLPNAPEGELSRIKSVVVSEAALAEKGIEMGIPDLLLFGRGEELSGGRNKKALIADAFEALVGAIFLDQGHAAASSFVCGSLKPSIKATILGQSKDYKTILQEYSQKYLRCLPVYRCERVEGPEHDKVFWISCTLGASVHGPFPGKTKKESEQNAAENVCRSLAEKNPEIAGQLQDIASLSH